MPDSSRPSRPRANDGRRSGGDGDWSDTSWSESTYRRSTQNGGHDDGGWGSPSYSNAPRDPAESSRGSRPADVRRPDGRGSVDRDPANRGGGARTATRDRQQDTPGTARRPADRQPRDRAAGQERDRRTDTRRTAGDDWVKGGPTTSREQRATRAADRRAELEAERTRRSVERLRTQHDAARLRGEPKPPERGVPWWGALGILVAITLLGALIDSIGNVDGQNGFNYGIVVATIVAIVAVKRSQMFPIVVAPPIVYALAAMLQLYIKTRGTDSRSSLLIDAVQNYLVYGFPALAAATAAGLIIAGIRLVVRR